MTFRSTNLILIFVVALVLGCGESQTPSGPEAGSVQAYLDSNPDIAARVDEEAETDEEEDDGSGE